MTNVNKRRVQLTITVGALIAALVHLIWPDIAIDSVTFALLLLAAIPWLLPLFKSVEFPGGWKLEFRDYERAKKNAQSAGLLGVPEVPAASQKHLFESLAHQDPNLALAELRNQIERRLLELAAIGGVELKIGGLGYLLKTLEKHNLLTSEQQSVLAEITGMLNASIHGRVVNYLAVVWVLETGPELLQGLDVQIEKIRQSSNDA